MRVVLLAILVILSIAPVAKAQTLVILREGVADTGETLHYAQVVQFKGRWIPLSATYIDFGHPTQSREILVGGGLKVLNNKHVRLTHITFLARADGVKNGSGGLSIVTWQGFDVMKGRLLWDNVAFSYWPIGGTAVRRDVVDRSRVNWAVSKHWSAGGGYAGSRPIGKPWDHRPFVDVIFKTKKVGALEFWFQRMPIQNKSHLNLQVRWIRTF